MAPHPNRRLRIDTRAPVPIDPLEQRFSSPSLVPGMGIMSLLSMLLNIEEKSYDQQSSPRRASSSIGRQPSKNSACSKSRRGSISASRMA